MCETEEDERRQQHRRATTGVCERGEALCEDAEQQVRTMILVVRESMRRRYISQRYCRSRLRSVFLNTRPAAQHVEQMLRAPKTHRFASGRLCSAQIRADPQPAQRAKKIFFLVEILV